MQNKRVNQKHEQEICFRNRSENLITKKLVEIINIISEIQNSMVG